MHSTSIYVYIHVHTQIHTHTHTLAQKYLIELLMWNVSYVQKNTPVNLTGEIGRPYVENSATYAFYVLAQRNVLMQLCQS